MIDEQKTLTEIHGRFERIINLFHRIEKQPKDFGTGELLYIGEVHTIVAVGRYPEINITELARKIGVTKGAVSQAIGKLEKRGYLKRIKDKNNEKHVLVELTDKGNIVSDEHDRIHRDVHTTFLKETTLGQHIVFNEVLEKIEAFLESNIWEDL